MTRPERELADVTLAWGKTDPGGAWHPLALHGIDTVAVAEELWRSWLGPRERVLVAWPGRVTDTPLSRGLRAPLR